MNLYHYCSTEKFFNILKSKTIRLSDISKSNDASELALMFPTLHRCILKKYLENPFPFKLSTYSNEDAMHELILISESYWAQQFEDGSFANFVLCLSEAKDCLSQWRGYADDGKGCCIGFSKDILHQFCDSTGGVLLLKKVQYITQKELNSIVDCLADEILQTLRTLRKWIVENMTHDDNISDTDDLLEYNFSGMIEHAFTQSLSLKLEHFSEEQEWRIFLTDQAHKSPDLVLGDRKNTLGPEIFSKTLSFLNNRIDFGWTSDDLIPFCPLNFDEFSTMPISEIILGPKSKIRNSDINLFLQKYGYPKIDIHSSKITYR